MEERIEKRKVVAYCRVSTDTEEQLKSLREQQMFFEKYAADNRFELVKVYVDEGISGTKLKNRTQFLRLMQDAELGKFSLVLVKDISRLARNVLDFVQSIRRLKFLGVDCKFITANMSATDGELSLTIMAAVAQEESANMSKRVKFTKLNNAKKGRVPGMVLGYDKVPGNYFELHINEKEAKIVRRIFDCYVNRGMGIRKIAQLLREEGTLTKARCRFTESSVKRILSNELYMGRLVTHKTETVDFLTGRRKQIAPSEQYVFDRAELALVDRKLFNQAQKIRSERSGKMPCLKPKSHSSKRIFSTVIICAECGHTFRCRDIATLERNYTIWFCNGRSFRGADFCHNTVKINEKELYDEICTYLLGQVQSEEELLAAVVKKFRARYYADDGITAEDITLEIQKLQKRKAKQIELFEMDAVTKEELASRLADIRKLLESKEKELLAVRGTEIAAGKLETMVRRYCRDAKTALEVAMMDNTILKRLIEKIVVNRDGEVEVHLKVFEGR